MIVEKRADGKVETEATIKIWVDGERYVRTAEGNGPVNALDNALRAAIGESHPHLQRHRARQLQGPHPRRDEGHRRGHARAARRLRRPRRVGLDRRLRERHRGVLGGARRLARVRRCSRAARGHARRRAARDRAERTSRRRPHRTSIPLAQPGPRRARGGAGRSRCCARASSRSARACRRSSRRSRARLGVRARAAPSRAAPPACTSRCARSACSDGRRGRHVAVLVRRLGQRDPLRARAAGVRRHRPGHAQPRPGRGRGGASRERTTALLPVHIFGYPGRPAGVRARSACRSSRTPARRSAPSTPTARRSAAAATRRSSASTRTSSSRRARAAWSRSATPR